MNFNPKRLGSGSLAADNASLCTVGVGKTVIVKELVLCNLNSAPQTVNMHVVNSGDVASSSNIFLAQQLVDQNSTLVMALSTVLLDGDTIQASCSSDGAVSYRISAMESA